MEAPWTVADVRLEFRRRAKAVATAITDAQKICGEPVASFVCLISQEEEPCRSHLQVFRREGLPDDLRELVDDTRPEVEGNRLPIVLWALDGNAWIMWSHVYLAAPGGDA